MFPTSGPAVCRTPLLVARNLKPPFRFHLHNTPTFVTEQEVKLVDNTKIARRWACDYFVLDLTTKFAWRVHLLHLAGICCEIKDASKSRHTTTVTTCNLLQSSTKDCLWLTAPISEFMQSSPNSQWWKYPLAQSLPSSHPVRAGLISRKRNMHLRAASLDVTW